MRFASMNLLDLIEDDQTILKLTKCSTDLGCMISIFISLSSGSTTNGEIEIVIRP